MDVLVVGAGPCGLMAGMTLARYGIDVLVVEQRSGEYNLSRALVISTRGMELMRRFGLEQQVRASAADVDSTALVTPTLASGEGAVMTLGYPSDKEAARVSPCRPSWTPPGVPRTATARAPPGRTVGGAAVRNPGDRRQVEAHYAIAADGAHSTARTALGIAMEGPDDLAVYERVEFLAALDEAVGERRHALYVLEHPDVDGRPLGGTARAFCAGWVLILSQVAQDSHSVGRMEMDGHTVGPDLTMGSAPLFFLMWVAMMVAMMFPSAAPMILVFAKSQNGKHNGSITLFVAAYLALWVVFGAVAFSLGAGVEALAERSGWVSRNWARAGGVLVVAAGLYQLSPLKRRCLAKCRSPLSFLLQRWRSGWTGAMRMGLEHGVYCLGCCWLLFLVLVPLGVMNLAAMLMVTFVVFAEKALPWGRAAGHVAAAALMLYGLAVVVRPALLPTMA